MGKTKIAPVKMKGPKLKSLVATVLDIIRIETNIVEIIAKYFDVCVILSKCSPYKI